MNMKKNPVRWTTLLLALSLLLSCTACGGNTAEAATMKLAKTEGTVGVSNGEDKEIEVVENLGLYSGYQVGTQTDSYAWINLDNVKLTKMDADSEVEITKNGKKLEINVMSGSLFFNIIEPLADDEALDIRTSTMIVGIRGTCGWVTDNTACLLEGTVAITAGGQGVTVAAGEMAVMKADGTLEVEQLSAGDVPAFVLEEVEDDEELMEIIVGSETPIDPDNASTSSGSASISWAGAGLADHVMDWRDEALAAAMANITGISDRDIMLSDVWELKSLWLSGYYGISDVSALAELTNLTSLSLSQTGISDISALEALTNLNYLDLSGNNISDISALSELTNLDHLALDWNSIHDISALAKLTNLVELTLDENNVSDISALGGLTKLVYMVLSENDITDVSALSGLTNLEALYLNNNNISDISALGDLANLTALALAGNNVSDISALGGLTKLTYLILSANDITDVSALSGLTDLAYLVLTYNNVSDYSPVEFVPELHK